MEKNQIRSENPKKEAALAYASRGWKVLPLHSVINGRCSCGNPLCDSHGKHPHIKKNWPDVATDDPFQIEEWWEDWPDANIGILTGAASGIFVLDVDVKPDKDGEASLAALEKEQGPLPPTVMAHTGSRGRHLFFKYPQRGEIGNSVSRIGPGLDIRGDNGYVVAPPSGHISGGVYSWYEGHLPDDVAIADAPTWLLEDIQKSQILTSWPDLIRGDPQKAA